MTITFACEHCTQRYSVGGDLAGKRVRCKKCGKVLSIPSPNAGAAKPAAKARDAGQDDRFGLSDSPKIPAGADDLAGSVIGRRGAPKRKGGPGWLAEGKTRYAVFGGGGAIALILIVVLVSASSRKKKESPSGPLGDAPAVIAHRNTLNEGLAALSELNDATESITDEAGARAAEPRIREAIGKLQALADRTVLATKLGRNAKKTLRAEFAGKAEAALDRWRSEVRRLRTIPGVPDHLGSLAEMVRIPD